MKRYILRHTVERFEQILAEDGLSERERQYAASEIASMRRHLALLDAESIGGQRYPNQIGQPSPIDQKLFRRLIEGSPEALLVIDPRPGLHIVEMTPSFQAVTMISRESTAGEALFNVFPDNPDLPDADGVRNVYDSLRTAASTGHPSIMDILRYDVRDKLGQFVKRYWRTVHIPILNDDAQLVWLLTKLEDVTDHVESLGVPVR